MLRNRHNLIEVPINSYGVPAEKSVNVNKSLPNIMVLNARSLRNKVDELSVRANQTMSDLICITETWLTNHIPDDIVNINGYSVVRKDRANDNNSGGGICTYIKETIPFRLRSDLSHNSIECIWVTIRPNWLPRSVSRIAVATIYLPPSTTNNEIDKFYDYLCYCIDTLILESIETAFIITGDFNPNSNTFRSRLVEQQCNLKQVVHVPTRNGHILDLILTNISKYYNAPITQAPLDTSDHLVVLWQAKGIEKSKNVTRKVEVRPIKESSLESFGEWLRTYQWESTMSMYSLNEKL